MSCMPTSTVVDWSVHACNSGLHINIMLDVLAIINSDSLHTRHIFSPPHWILCFELGGGRLGKYSTLFEDQNMVEDGPWTVARQ